MKLKQISSRGCGHLLRSVLFASVLAGAVAGCSSKGKSVRDEPRIGNRGSEELDLEGDETSGGSGGKNLGPESAASLDSTDKQYRALGQAVRSGKAGAVVDEASKILGSNQYDAVALNTLAMYHFRRGRPGAAKLLLTRALEKNQTSPALFNNFAIVLLEEDDQAGAVVNLKKALRLDDDHTEALGNLGSIYVKGGDYTKAQPLLDQAYRKNRANAAIANNYAISLRAAKNHDGAKKVYEDALKQNSKDVSLLLNHAILLIDYLNKPKDGLALVYKVKFLETEKKDVLAKANALEKRAKSELK